MSNFDIAGMVDQIAAQLNLSPAQDEPVVVGPVAAWDYHWADQKTLWWAMVVAKPRQATMAFLAPVALDPLVNVKGADTCIVVGPHAGLPPSEAKALWRQLADEIAARFPSAKVCGTEIATAQAWQAIDDRPRVRTVVADLAADCMQSSADDSPDAPPGVPPV